MKRTAKPSFQKNCLLFIIGLTPVCFIGAVILPAIGYFLSKGDPVRKSDAIVILSGDDGARVREAAALYQAGNGTYLVITKTDDEDIGEQRTYSEKLMRIAITEGIPQDSILFTEKIAIDTIAEAKSVLQLAQTRNLNSLLVITSPYHVRRASCIYYQIFAGKNIEISVRGVQNSWYRPTTWFLSVEGWKQTTQELAGLFYLFINPGQLK